MCQYCLIATQLAGKAYMCRTCWRRLHHNRKKGK